MRRLWIVLLLLLTGTATGSGVLWRMNTRPAAYAPLGPGESYLALGDSLAAGFTVGDPAEAYVARLATAMRDMNPATAITNLAVPGETSHSFRARQLPRALAYIAEERAAGRRVSPITIDIGGNDARAVERADRATREATIREVEHNLGYALDRLIAATRGRAGRRTADIVVMDYYNPFAGDPADPESPAYWAERLNAAIRRAAESRNIPVADVATAFGGGLVYRYTYIAAGDIHANADGHGVIAEQFWRALAYSGSITR
jgi:lysophospholipase L1-like esterase